MENLSYNTMHTFVEGDKEVWIHKTNVHKYSAHTRHGVVTLNRAPKGEEEARVEIDLSLDKNDKLYKARVPNFAKKEVFLDTGNIRVTLKLATMAYSPKTKTLFCKETNIFVLYKEKASGKMSAFKDGKFVYTTRGLTTLLYTLVSFTTPSIYGVIEVGGYYGHLLASYRLSRVPTVKDLPWEHQALLNLYSDSHETIPKQRAKVLRALREGNTKKAIRQVFYGYKYPKSVNKQLLKFSPFSFSELFHKTLYELCSVLNPNQVVAILAMNSNMIQPIHILLGLGFSYKHLINVAKKNPATVTDTAVIAMRLENEVNIRPTPEDKETLSEFHNRISDLLDSHINKNKYAENQLYKATDTSEDLPMFSENGYTIRAPKTADELRTIGSQMSICVGSYARSVFLKTKTIGVVLDSSNNYVACLEFIGNNIVQAKLKRNRRLVSDTSINDLVTKYAKEYGFVINTHDMDEFIEYVSPLKACPEREKELEKLRGIPVRNYFADLVANNPF